MLLAGQESEIIAELEWPIVSTGPRQAFCEWAVLVIPLKTNETGCALADISRLR